jgi:cytochrome c-type biogenesis protein CcmH
MRRWLAVLVLALSCFAASSGHAATNPDEILQDPALEQRARGLSKQLRCLVCQNQSIDDSDADLARDLRRIVREQLVAGRSDSEIMAYVTARYGDFVLLRPPVKPATWGLWFGPAFVLVIAAAGLVIYLRARSGRPDHRPPDLDAEERRRLDALLREESATRGS